MKKQNPHPLAFEARVGIGAREPSVSRLERGGDGGTKRERQLSTNKACDFHVTLFGCRVGDTRASSFTASLGIFPREHEGSAHSAPAIAAIVLSPRITPRFYLMSHSPLTRASTSSSNFQLVINNALKAYEKRTKNDLLAHPLASQLLSCDSPGDIIAVLQQQVQGLDQSQSSDDRWTKWVDPTVNILYALSGTLGEGVGLVSLLI